MYVWCRHNKSAVAILSPHMKKKLSKCLIGRALNFRQQKTHQP
nr:MAG TPA: hypothetical protein [Caudoviricetes sp.]